MLLNGIGLLLLKHTITARSDIVVVVVHLLLLLLPFGHEGVLETRLPRSPFMLNCCINIGYCVNQNDCNQPTSYTLCKRTDVDSNIEE